MFHIQLKTLAKYGSIQQLSRTIRVSFPLGGSPHVLSLLSSGTTLTTLLCPPRRQCSLTCLRWKQHSFENRFFYISSSHDPLLSFSFTVSRAWQCLPCLSISCICVSPHHHFFCRWPLSALHGKYFLHVWLSLSLCLFVTTYG